MRLLALALSLLAMPAAADVISEIGMGVKIERSTSYLMLPACRTAVVTDPIWPENPRGYGLYSCGGDDPLFIGWPVAWQSDFSDVWTVRAGWMHFSHWFDGGSDRELHMDAIASTVTFNWSAWKRNRR